MSISSAASRSTRVEEVFRTAGTLLGRRLKRCPDGEPGGRRLWISWQYPLLRANAYLQIDPVALGQAGMFPKLRLADGVKTEDIHFGELGYAREARASYQDFLSSRSRGELAPGTRVPGLPADADGGDPAVLRDAGHRRDRAGL